MILSKMIHLEKPMLEVSSQCKNLTWKGKTNVSNLKFRKMQQYIYIRHPRSYTFFIFCLFCEIRSIWRRSVQRVWPFCCRLFLCTDVQRPLFFRRSFFCLRWPIWYHCKHARARPVCSKAERVNSCTSSRSRPLHLQTHKSWFSSQGSIHDYREQCGQFRPVCRKNECQRGVGSIWFSGQRERSLQLLSTQLCSGCGE